MNDVEHPHVRFASQFLADLLVLRRREIVAEARRAIVSLHPLRIEDSMRTLNAYLETYDALLTPEFAFEVDEVIDSLIVAHRVSRGSK